MPLVIGGLLVLYSKRFGFTDIHGEPHCVTGLEFGVISPIIVLFALLVTVVWGPDMARAQAAEGYQQFFNGSVTRAVQEEIPCERDGSCIHEYKCDPYLDTETYYETETYIGADGKSATRSVAKTRTVTKYHDCPEATHEYNYKLETNIGDTITVASHIFAANPQRWRRGEQLSANVPRGAPESWVVSLQRLQAGDAEPVTGVKSYTNYILPSEGTLYKKNSGNIAKYKQAGLLPEHTQGLQGNPTFGLVPQARKMQFVGGLAADSMETWTDRLMRFNAVLGPTRQGDLHIVAMPADAVSNPQDYLNALMAHWQSDLGKWGFPKNGIALVLGVGNDGRIKWSRAKTGMPGGNGSMLSAMTLNLEGERFDPDVLLGKATVAPVLDGKGNLVLDKDGDPLFNYGGSDGRLGKIIFREFPFKRVCMNCKDKDDEGTGYVYLKDSIPVSTGYMWFWFFLVFFVSLGLWAAAFYWDPVNAIRRGKGSTPRSDQFPGSFSRAPYRTGRF